MNNVLSPTHKESLDWVRTIEQGKGYADIDEVSFRKLLHRMNKYVFFQVLLRYTQPGDSVLEAGCGWATSSFALAEQERNIIAVDISPQLVVRLKNLQGKLGGCFKEYLTCIEGDIFRLPEIIGFRDLVFSDGTYEHFLKIDDRRTMISNIRSILKDDGLFIVSVPNLHNPFFQRVVHHTMPAMYPFTTNSLSGELQNNGFDVLESGFSFVNPGFVQWTKSWWMIPPIHLINIIYRHLPISLRRVTAAHLYCVARKSH